MTPKIAIIGAGPGGCMLARLLHQASIPCTLFEAGASIDYGSQGGTLDLRQKTGLAAIKQAGLFDEFLKLARYDGEYLLVCDKKQTTWMQRQPSRQGESNAIQEAPEIDRALLRKLLVDSVPKDIVRWNYRLKRVESDLSLHFENGEVMGGFDLIVGADGAFSKVRNLVSSEKPFYSGISGYSLKVQDAAHVAPEAYALVNRGNVFAYSDCKNVNGQQIGDGSIWVSFNAQVDENWLDASSVDTRDQKSVKAHILREIHDWSPGLRNLVEKTNGDFVQARKLWMLRPDFRWEHKKGITLLGDAAHLMTPFAGIGVNNAFHDAMIIATAITDFIKSGRPVDGLDGYIVEYEREMFEQSKQAAQKTFGCMEAMLMTPGAPRTSIESWLLWHVKDDISSWLYPFVAAAVYTGYFFYKLFV